MDMVLPTNVTCSNVCVFLLSKFEFACQEKLIIFQLDNNTYTLHLTPLYFLTLCPKKENCRNHIIWYMSTFILQYWREVKNIVRFVTERQIIVFISCGKFKGGSLTVNFIKIYPARMPTLFFIHFSIRFNYLLIFNTSQSFLASLN